MRVHLAVEHALQLETPHLGFQRLSFALDVVRGGLVVFAFRKIEQLGGVRDALAGTIEIGGLRRQARTLAP